MKSHDEVDLQHLSAHNVDAYRNKVASAILKKASRTGLAPCHVAIDVIPSAQVPSKARNVFEASLSSREDHFHAYSDTFECFKSPSIPIIIPCISVSAFATTHGRRWVLLEQIELSSDGNSYLHYPSGDEVLNASPTSGPHAVMLLDPNSSTSLLTSKACTQGIKKQQGS